MREIRCILKHVDRGCLSHIGPGRNEHQNHPGREEGVYRGFGSDSIRRSIRRETASLEAKGRLGERIRQRLLIPSNVVVQVSLSLLKAMYSVIV